MSSAELVTLSNGATQDLDTGRIVAGGIKSSEDGRRLAQRRHEMARAAVAAALRTQPDCRTSADGLKIIALAQIELASNPEAGRAATAAAQFIWKAGDFMPARDVAQGPLIQVNVVIQGDVARQLGEIGEIVEGEVHEG